MPLVKTDSLHLLATQCVSVQCICSYWPYRKLCCKLGLKKYNPHLFCVATSLL